VKVTLDISYQDISKLPKLVQQIKNNIKDELSTSPIAADLPDVLVLDGSRPFRVHFRDMTDNSVQVVVDTHLRVRPFSDEYWDLRQAILFAVTKATESNDIRFAYKDKNKMVVPAATRSGLFITSTDAEIDEFESVMEEGDNFGQEADEEIVLVGHQRSSPFNGTTASKAASASASVNGNSASS
jgi:hypothetical protein